MAQFSLKQMLLAVVCLSVAIAIVAVDVRSGEYWERGRVPLPLGFLVLHPHFLAAVGGTIGTLANRFWTGLVIGVGIGFAIPVGFVLLLFLGGGGC